MWLLRVKNLYKCERRFEMSKHERRVRKALVLKTGGDQGMRSN